MNLINADCIIAMKEMAENSVDSIITDPPYELGFMGKSWDSTGIAFNVEVWQEALRVLKPGGHLIAFSGSRTYHRMAVAIEDAGFQIRDQIMWVYGSGFPKSHNISKGIDKSENNEVWENNAYGGGNSKCDKCGKWMISGSPCQCPKPIVEFKTAAAKQWDGWGTALKPAHEPMVLARKPVEGTVANNVMTWGVGGLNIDATRVGTDDNLSVGSNNRKNGAINFGMADDKEAQTQSPLGRFPANFIHDGSDEVVALFPDKAGGGHWTKTKVTGFGEFGGGTSEYLGQGEKDGFGSAARFFYCAKASKRDRNEGSVNNHPTVKPTDLMRYLCKLVTPPNGTVLDPFMGSGSTGKACTYEGFNFIGIDQSAEYVEIAKARIGFAKKEKHK